ncbi:MAG: prepilin-type N-terminal cleavage/methylation domain-containing protein [Gemmatimonadota bacterium]|nr:prepilin-type N-terminal cleavage/methylation domain-containing protein [Gemmatimonadota bacterium]
MTRRGFTLVEIMVATALTGIVVMLVGEIYRAVASGARQVEVHRAALDRRMNASRWLGRALGNLELGTPGTAPFRGESNGARFTAWLPTAHGWLEQSDLHLSLVDSAVSVRLGSGGSFKLWVAVSEVHIDYLLVPGAESGWVDRWESPVSAPVAIRLRLTYADSAATTDTLLFAMGGRG